MVWLVRHRQTKGPVTDRPGLNHRATSLLYQVNEAGIGVYVVRASEGPPSDESILHAEGATEALLDNADSGFGREHEWH